MPDDPRAIARRLTKAQRRELLLTIENEIDGCHATYFVPGYRPGDRLYELDLIERVNSRWSGNAYFPTDLGRAVAAALREGGDA